MSIGVDKDDIDAVIPYTLNRVYQIRIAVCDDEQFFIDSLSNAICEYSESRGLAISIDRFTSGEGLLSGVNDHDIVLLDYNMGGINGLETAKALRKKNIYCTIIFLTSYTQFVFESFKVSPFRFFKKPLDTQELHKALDEYFEQFGNNYPLQLTVNRETICIRTNDIIYLEADKKKCYIILAKERMHCAKSMGAVASLLPDNIFFKVNKAFIVNFNHIEKYDNDLIHFRNGDSVHVSRKYLTPFKTAFKQFAKASSMY